MSDMDLTGLKCGQGGRLQRKLLTFSNFWRCPQSLAPGPFLQPHIHQCCISLTLLSSESFLFVCLFVYLSVVFRLGFFFVCFLFFWLIIWHVGSYNPQPGFEPGPPAVEEQSPNLWTTVDDPLWFFFCSHSSLSSQHGRVSAFKDA